MIKLVRKIENLEDPKIITSSWPLMSSLNEDYIPKLFEINGNKFCFISELNSFILPKDTTISIGDILNETEILPWNLERLSPIPEKNYILNQYLRGDTTHFVTINSKKQEELIGSWRCYNDEGDSITFSMITTDKFCYSDDEKRLLICYPEKTEIPYDCNKIKIKTTFILFNLWKNLLLEK